MPLAHTKDGAAIHFDVAGSGEPLLLVSGLGGNASFWKGLVPQFAKGFRTITYDHRGAGRSTMSRIAYSVEQMAVDALAVVDAVGVEKVHVLGHSTGGCIGQILALDQPGRVSSLVVSSSWAAADSYFTRVFEGRLDLLQHCGIPAYVRASTLVQYPPAWIVANGKSIETQERSAIASFPHPDIVCSKIKALLRFDRSLDLRLIQAPTLVHAAIDDVIAPYHLSTTLARSIPNSQFAYTKGGHFCPVTEPEAYVRNLVRFYRPLLNESTASGWPD